MDWLQFWSSVIEAVAWPVVVLVLGLVFRNQVRTLLHKLQSAKGAGIELIFAQTVARVEQDVKLLTSVARSSALSPKEPSATSTSAGDNGSMIARQDSGERQVRWRTTDALPKELWDLERFDESNANRYRPAERPAAVVLDAWNTLARALDETVTRLGLGRPEVKLSRERRATFAANTLAKAKLLGEGGMGVIFELESLRDKVAENKFEPDASSARSYVRSVGRLIEFLNTLASPPPPRPK